MLTFSFWLEFDPHDQACIMSPLVGIDCSDTTAMHLDYGFVLVVLSCRSAVHCCLILRHERGLVQAVHICLGLYCGNGGIYTG